MGNPHSEYYRYGGGDGGKELNGDGDGNGTPSLDSPVPNSGQNLSIKAGLQGKVPLHLCVIRTEGVYLASFSCQFGDRCKFLHVIQQQQKSNIFGFGSLSGSDQQRKSNPYGFGVQNNSQSKGPADFGSKQSQFKPFENKWSRFSSQTASAAPSSQKSDKQPQATNHRCTDPDSCRSIIIEDNEHESPLWKLTCYGHWKNFPCDIVGDISYEELRAAAYDDAKRGLNMQSIVERERNLLNTKLIEFDKLCNPQGALLKPNHSSQNPLPSASQNAFLQAANNSAAPSLSSFSQLGTSLNTGFGPRPSAPSNNGFAQLNPFANSTQTSSGFGTNNFLSGSAGSRGSQFPATAHVNVFPSSTGFGNTGVMRHETNPFSTLAVSSQIPSATTGLSPILSDGPTSASNAVGQSTTEVQFLTNMQRDKISGEMSIWLKKIWSPGEVAKALNACETQNGDSNLELEPRRSLEMLRKEGLPPIVRRNNPIIFCNICKDICIYLILYTVPVKIHNTIAINVLQMAKPALRMSCFVLCPCDAPTEGNNVGTECVMDYSDQFTTYMIFNGRNALLRWAREQGKMNNIVIVIKRSDYGGEGKRRPRVIFACERNGNYKSCKSSETTDIRSDANSDMKKCAMDTGTKKCGCPFLLKGVNIGDGDDWKLEVVCGVHNHPISEYLQGKGDNFISLPFLQQPSPFAVAGGKSPLHKLATLLGIRPLSSPMPPKKKTISNSMASQDELDYGDSESRQNSSLREEEHASEGAFTLTNLVAAIRAMGETQREMVDIIKELKSSVSKPSKENERPPQEEPIAAKGSSEQKEPSFVTHKDVIAMLEKKLSRSQGDWNYKAPNFILFDGRKGSPKEHVNRFIDALGPQADDCNLRLREFSKSLTDRAYTWYTTLAPGTHEERVTIIQLNYTRQKYGEDLVDFVHRFRDLALDCYDEKDEEALVEICISNIVADYRVYLGNIGVYLSWGSDLQQMQM
ncbi:unnamed protein product [Prunus armeniaca]